MDEVIKAMAQQISESFTRQLFGVYTDPPPSTMPPNIRDDLDRISALLSRPVPVAIWFIDRPREYRRVLEAVAVEEARHAGSGFQGYSGMPLYQWTLSEIEERVKALQAESCDEAFIKETFPFRLPGVWVQMRGAPHQPIIFVEETDEPEKFLRRMLNERNKR